jgi:hypothetical protein
MRVVQEGRSLSVQVFGYLSDGLSDKVFLREQDDLGRPDFQAELVIDCTSGEAVQLTTFLLALT